MIRKLKNIKPYYMTINTQPAIFSDFSPKISGERVTQLGIGNQS